MTPPIYLDYNASTPVAPEVLDVMVRVFRDVHGNALSGHAFGRAAREAVEAGIALRDEAIFGRDDAGELVMLGFRVAGDRDGSFRFAPEAGHIPQGSTLAAARTPTSHR